MTAMSLSISREVVTRNLDDVPSTCEISCGRWLGNGVRCGVKGDG
jgi:hypothetical protein